MTAELYMKLVCDYFGIEIKTLLSREQTKEIAAIRSLTAYSMHHFLSIQIRELAVILNRHRATVHVMLERVSDDLDVGYHDTTTHVEVLKGLAEQHVTISLGHLSDGDLVDLRETIAYLHKNTVYSDAMEKLNIEIDKRIKK